MLLFHWTKRARFDVVPWTLTFITKPGFTVVDAFVTQYYDEAGMYCVFIMDVLMCTAYTNLAKAFLISFPSKNGDLSSMLENSELNVRMIYSLSRLILSRFI